MENNRYFVLKCRLKLIVMDFLSLKEICVEEHKLHVCVIDLSPSIK